MGTVQPQHSGGRPTTASTSLEEDVLNYFDEDPTRSTTRAGFTFGISQPAAWRIVHRDDRHPYHYQKTQALLPRDFGPRVEFCQWYLSRIGANPEQAYKILWSDEASFTRGGLANNRNEHYWAHENPHVSRENHFQHRWRVNVWAGIIGTRLIGPVFLPSSLNADNYFEFLTTTLEDLLDDLPLAEYSGMVYQHDGAPAHYALICSEYLRERFPLWIGRGGPVAWPPRSPDLTPLDFFLWGYTKSIVYAQDCDDADEMRQRITSAFEGIRASPQMLQNTVVAVSRRASLCIEHGGGHFEPFL